LAEIGLEGMHQKLNEIDPAEAARIHPHNRRHLLRALEMFYQTGKKKSELVATGTYKKSQYRYVQFCLVPPRELLYDRINARVDRMFAAGWLNEMQVLLNNGISERLRQAEVIGYAELLEYFEGKTDLETATDLIKQNTRRFAKRQMTWFRGQGASPLYRTEAECLAAIKQHLGGES
jgi:tRNA dimethylallyltransferase